MLTLLKAEDTAMKVKRLVDEVTYHTGKENLVAFGFEEDGDRFFKICQYSKIALGHIIIAADGAISILSAVPGSREVAVSAIVALQTAAIIPPIP